MHTPIEMSWANPQPSDVKLLVSLLLPVVLTGHYRTHDVCFFVTVTAPTLLHGAWPKFNGLNGLALEGIVQDRMDLASL
jgi:hypothetical protein